MYRSKTTFIVGAGASLELGFPTSEKLKHEIAQALNFRFDRSGRLTSGELAIMAALDQYANHRVREQNIEHNLNLAAGQHISRAMPQAISIDNFVDNQQDERITRMAKLGIASCLISAENQCSKYHHLSGNISEIHWSNLSKTWIHYFWHTLHEGIPKTNVETIFDNVKFIIFNYDRSVEFILSRAINNYYGIELARSQKIVSQAHFYHPYGVIGRLPWQDGSQTALEFGPEDRPNLYEISQEILTFTERIEDQGQLSAIRTAVNEADQLVFLGFAFHDANMELLAPKRDRDTSRVIATAYGISDSDCEVVKSTVHAMCFREGPHRQKEGNPIVDNTITCSELFQKYGRKLRS